jgi:hypothetical protein
MKEGTSMDKTLQDYLSRVWEIDEGDSMKMKANVVYKDAPENLLSWELTDSELRAREDQKSFLEFQAQRDSIDMINHPPHYNSGDIECIDAIKSALGKEGFIAYCRGNSIKYLWRCEHKGKRIEDLKKAAFYINEITEERGND